MGWVILKKAIERKRRKQIINELNISQVATAR